MRIERFTAGLGAALALLAASCGAQKILKDPVPPVVFPLSEAVRIPVKGPLVSRLTAGPGGLILAASTAGELQAIDVSTLAVRWTYKAGPTQTPPAVAGKRIIWAVEDGRVIGLEASGREIWSRKLENPVRGELRAVGGRIVFREGDQFLSALNAEDGTVLWRREAGSLPEDWTSTENRIICRTTDGRLRFLDPDGRLIREFSAGEMTAGSLGLSADLIFAGSADGRFGAFDPATGKLKWSIRLGGYPVGAPVFQGRDVYAVLSNHVLAALRASNGHLHWWTPLWGRAAFPPCPAGERLFAASRSSVLQAFETADGGERTVFTASGDLLAPPVLMGSKIFLSLNGDTDGEALVLVLDLAPPQPQVKTKIPVSRP